MYAYTSNNPVMRVDPSGYAWYHWAIAGAVVVGLGIAVVATAGGAAPAAFAVVAAMNGVASASVATTVASFAFVGASTALAGSAAYAYANSSNADEFADYGEEALISTTVGGTIGAMVGYSTHSAAFSNCFVAGTLIKTSEGDKPIEDIEVGDLVYSENPETGETELKPVVNLFRNEKTDLVHIQVNGQEITTTNEHPFYVIEKGWVFAKDLRAGDKLVLLSGEIVIVEFVQHEILESPVTTYNFEVKDFHTYYVSELGVLVHNTCEVPVGGELSSEGIPNSTALRYIREIFIKQQHIILKVKKYQELILWANHIILMVDMNYHMLILENIMV
jgi:hypothetical protein